MKSLRTAALALLLSFVLGGVASAMTFGRMNAPGVGPDAGVSAAYCASTGGTVQQRIPAYGTNNPNPLYLAGPRPFCEYTSAKDGSHIWVLLDTLYAAKPTLAALAYYAKVTPGTCQGNPASCYCSLLGGTDLFGGINAAGGGWILAGSPTDVLDTCIFPDESSIDSFGLFYHSAGIIRGTNLAKVLRYQK